MASTNTLRLSLVQFAPRLRDESGNAATIAERARASAADIVVTPELSLTGYDIGDAVHHLARPLEVGSTFDDPALASVPGNVIIGCIESAPRGPFNTAIVLSQGTIVFRHRKLYLPTYGMFDEGRWFGRGTSLDVWTTPQGWRVGILVCEDFWHPALTYVLASRGIDMLVVTVAAPGRGVWEGGEHGRFASSDSWERMARVAARIYGIYVALCNRVGVEGAVTFAGGSLLVGPDGEVIARPSNHGADVLVADLSRAALQQAARPFAHARDDDARLVIRELERGLQDAS